MGDAIAGGEQIRAEAEGFGGLIEGGAEWRGIVGEQAGVDGFLKGEDGRLETVEGGSEVEEGGCLLNALAEAVGREGFGRGAGGGGGGECLFEVVAQLLEVFGGEEADLVRIFPMAEPPTLAGLVHPAIFGEGEEIAHVGGGGAVKLGVVGIEDAIGIGLRIPEEACGEVGGMAIVGPEGGDLGKVATEASLVEGGNGIGDNLGEGARDEEAVAEEIIPCGRGQVGVVGPAPDEAEVIGAGGGIVPLGPVEGEVGDDAWMDGKVGDIFPDQVGKGAEE